MIPKVSLNLENFEMPQALFRKISALKQQLEEGETLKGICEDAQAAVELLEMGVSANPKISTNTLIYTLTQTRAKMNLP